jgi:hypothetical protein
MSGYQRRTDSERLSSRRPAMPNKAMQRDGRQSRPLLTADIEQKVRSHDL